MQYTHWKKILQASNPKPVDLLNTLNIDDHTLVSEQANKQFPLKVPPRFVHKMSLNDPHDPLLMQVLPDRKEDIVEDGYTLDPLNEFNRQNTAGLLHKYHARVLLVLTGACAIHCRYCFRRHFPYANSTSSGTALYQAFEYIQAHDNITEVILSGGDPLSLPDQHLAHVVTQLEAITHLKRLRIHTRFPIVVPERINDNCLKWLTTSRLKIIMVVHVNHANELDETVRQTMLKLSHHHIPLFNQSVLLKGVNDSVTTLADLSETLFNCNVIPYYLHLLDPVVGASHFKVDKSHSQRLMHELQKRLPGYLLPKLVQENPGRAYKTIIAF